MPNVMMLREVSTRCAAPSHPRCAALDCYPSSWPANLRVDLNAAVSAGHCIFGDGVGVGVGRINPFYWPGKGNACGFPDGTSITGQCWTNLTGGVWLSFQKPGECKNGAPIGANGAAALPSFPVLLDLLLRLRVASTYRGKYRCCSSAGCAWGAVSGLPLKTINRKCIIEHGFRRQCNNATLIEDLGCKVRATFAPSRFSSHDASLF